MVPGIITWSLMIKDYRFDWEWCSDWRGNVSNDSDMWELKDFVFTLHPSTSLMYLVDVTEKYHDGYRQLADAIGLTRATASHWRKGRRNQSKPVQFIMRLAKVHGWNALLSGTLAIPSDKVAQDSTQVPKPKRTRKRKAK